MEYLDPFMRGYLLVLAGVLGTVLGSFVNCWAWRSQHGESVLQGRSHCTSCGHALGPIDLVPVLSWLLSRGRCRYCGERVSVRYPLTELVLGTVFVALVLVYGPTLETVELMAFSCVLLFLSLTDIDDFRIPNASLVVAAAIRAAYLACALALGMMPMAQVASLIVGGLVVGLVLLLIVLAFDRVVGRESMGGGDLKLYAVSALYVGWQQSLFLIVLSCLLGLASSLVFVPRGEADRARKPFPFGPSIAAATIVTLLCGTRIVGWYLGLFY